MSSQTESLWLEEPAPALAERPMDGRRPDAVVVGGGVTGCACALVLAGEGLRVRLVEARRVAGGASGRNGGFALRGAALPYDVARTRLGVDDAARLWRLSEDALDRIGDLAGDALRRCGSLRLAADNQEAAELRAEYEALREDGFAAEWVTDLPAPLEGRFPAAFRHPRDGALHPARWVRRLAAAAAEAGVEIVEHHRVGAVDDLDAEHVVVATDGYTGGLLPELDAIVRPARGQVLVTEPLDELLFPCPHYARRGFDYWQQLPDGRLVLGGRRDVALEHEYTREEETTAAVQTELDRFLRELLGAKPAVTHRWAGIWGETPDLLPLVGPVPGRRGVWAACGYSGHGNVLGFACGEMVARAIAGDPPEELRLFDPARLL